MGPLKLAVLNGLTLSRMPLHDESKDEPEKASNDERVCLALLLIMSRTAVTIEEN